MFSFDGILVPLFLDATSGHRLRRTVHWVISLFGFVLLLSGITTSTHRPRGVIIVGIYMSSNIYYLLVVYLSRRELRRRIGLQTYKRDIFTKLSQLDVCKLIHLHHFF